MMRALSALNLKNSMLLQVVPTTFSKLHKEVDFGDGDDASSKLAKQYVCLER